MSINEITCYTVACDGCGEDIDLDGDGYDPVFESPEKARQAVEDAQSGVAVPGVGDFCESCMYEPHEYLPRVAAVPVGACRRCRVDIDEHDLAPVAAASIPTPIPGGEER